jgi:hypothetical protein
MVTGAVLAASKRSEPVEVPTRPLASDGRRHTVAGPAAMHALRKARPAAYHRGPVAVDPSSSGVTPRAGVRQGNQRK